MTAGATMAGRTSVAELLAVPEAQCDKRWLRACLQTAVELELTTVPPYLYAYWSVKDPASELADALLGIAWQEMLHMGFACNMLTAAGGRPRIAGGGGEDSAAPSYPAPLPGGVQRGLVVPLKGVSARAGDPDDVLRVFMDVEEPEHKVVPEAEGPTVGQFYARVRDELPGIARREGFGGGHQVTLKIGGDTLTPVRNAKDGVAAINLICEQGEGTSRSPSGGTDPAELAHFYRFAEHWHGRRMRKRPNENVWDFTGEEIPRAAVHPLGAVPKGGWTDPPEGIARALAECNEAYRAILVSLEKEWSGTARVASPDLGSDPMRRLDVAARHLIGLQPTPTYGPEFLP